MLLIHIDVATTIYNKLENIYDISFHIDAST